MRKFIFITLLCCCLISAESHAFSLRRIWGAIKELQQYESNFLPRLNDIAADSHQALNTLETLNHNVSGHFGYGLRDITHELGSNDHWLDVLAHHASPISAFNEAQQRYAQLYPTEESAHIRPHLSNHALTKVHYEETRNIARAALATSQYNYDDINTRIKHLHELLRQLETHPEEKAALDLNVRLVAELGFIQLQMLKQQAIQTQLMATRSQAEVNSLSDEAQFLRNNVH